MLKAKAKKLHGAGAGTWRAAALLVAAARTL
jgi:hypothetical protein